MCTIFASTLSADELDSYAAVVSFKAYNLFHNDWDKPYFTKWMEDLAHHLKFSNEMKKKMLDVYYGIHRQNFMETQESTNHLEKAYRCSNVLIQDLLHFTFNSGIYDARIRVLICDLAREFNISPEYVDLYEISCIDALQKNISVVDEKVQEVMMKRAKIKKIKRGVTIGLVTVASGVAIGLTGGLLTGPALGLSSMLGASTLGTFLGSTVMGLSVESTIVGSLFGIGQAGLCGFKMNKKMGKIRDFSFENLTKGTSLGVVVAVSGWLQNDDTEFISQWQNLKISHEQYSLRYEVGSLLEFGKNIESFHKPIPNIQKLFNFIPYRKKFIAPFFFNAVPGVIDDPRGICFSRAVQVGEQLARTLLNRNCGNRPITLIGYSIGARVIYYCLNEMYKIGNSYGIIQDVILLGAPVPSGEDWKNILKVVAGNIINGYSTRDTFLKYDFTVFSGSFNAAGLSPIKINDRRIINKDLSRIVSEHHHYLTRLSWILNYLNLPEVDSNVVGL